jgi:hypothetical protein
MKSGSCLATRSGSGLRLYWMAIQLESGVERLEYVLSGVGLYLLVIIFSH